MDFAKKQLEKYGWSEGKGLGKNEDGIVNAVKPKLKFDKSGVGHDPGKEYKDKWWENVFNVAAQNFEVKHDPDTNVVTFSKTKNAVPITTNHFRNQNKESYDKFLKTTTLVDGKVQHHHDVDVPEAPTSNTMNLSDDALFALCGRRTVHKGARHGIKMSGKLARIEKQEKMLLKKMKSVSLSDDSSNIDKKMKKLKKRKEEMAVDNIVQMHEDVPAKKKSKKKRKNVTFNDSTEVKYFTCDVDTSYESNQSSKDENSNEPGCLSPALLDLGQPSGPDEGIEQDIEVYNKGENDSHRSFEELRGSISDLSKAERKKLKKKRKLERKMAEKLAKLSFTEDSNDNKDNLEEASCSCLVSKKRKLITDDQDSDNKNKSSKKKKKCEKRQKKKERKREKIMNSIVQSLDTVCKISIADED